MADVDCVVVGGGIVGCSVARHLAAAGRSVLVLERDAIASGASGGLGRRGVRANGRDSRELALMPRAYELWTELGYQRTGHLQLTERSEDIDRFELIADRQRAAGVASVAMETARVRELEPDLSDLVCAAIWCPDDGVADHTAVTVAVADSARRAGAEIREGATPMPGKDGERLIVRVDDDVIDTATVVVAANAGTAALLEPIGVELPLFTVFPQVIVTGPLDHVPVLRLVGHAHRRLALKALPGRHVMITGGWLGRWDAEQGTGVTEPDAVLGNLADAGAVYPSLDGVAVETAVADRAESVARDFVPIVDRVPGVDNAFVVCGWSGHGWAIAPAIAELLAEWVLTGHRPSRLAPFALDRFA